MEEGVCLILRDAVNRGRGGLRTLATFTRECFASVGGVEFELFWRGSRLVSLIATTPDISRSQKWATVSTRNADEFSG